MRSKKIAILLLLSIFTLTSAACSSNVDNPGDAGSVNNEKTDLTIACAETTQAMVEAVVPLMAEKGYNVTYQLFDNNVNTLVATNDGSVDSVFLVHKPFMENFNEANAGNLVMLEPHVFAVGMGMFSEKYNSIDEIPDGASIAIMNDSMNMDRGLRILRDGGLITLSDNVEQATLIDIAENPHNFQFVEMDQTQTVRSLQDMDGVIAFFSHMKNADKDFNSYLIRDQHPEEYPQGVVVKAENADAPWARDLVEAFRSKEMREFAEDHYGGLYEYID